MENLDTYRVIIATTDPEEQAALREALERTGRIAVAAVTGNGLECIRAAMVERPHLILLDLVLEELSGLDVIHRLEKLMATPPILMVLSNGPQCLCDQAIAAGARTCLLRPCKPKAVAARALELLLPPLSFFNDFEIEQEIWRFCVLIGAPIHMKGFRCAQAGILLVMRNERLLDRVTDQLYPTIKQICGFSGDVEKNLRDFIGKLFRHGNAVALKRYFGYLPDESKAALTNSAFLLACAHCVTCRLLDKPSGGEGAGKDGLG